MEHVETVLQENLQMLGAQTSLGKDEVINLLKLCTDAAFFLNFRT